MQKKYDSISFYRTVHLNSCFVELRFPVIVHTFVDVWLLSLPVFIIDSVTSIIISSIIGHIEVWC